MTQGTKFHNEKDFFWNMIEFIKKKIITSRELLNIIIQIHYSKHELHSVLSHTHTLYTPNL